MAIKFAVDKHTVCNPGNLLASKYGEHMVSLNITQDTDNGRIVKVGEMETLDAYKVEEASTIDAYIFDKNADGTWLVVVNKAEERTALILLGRVNFTELTDKIAEAFASMIQTTCYEEVYNASSKLPNNSQFVKSGPLSSETKEKFDTLLEDVATANEAEIVIMGTKMALKKMNALADIDWRSNSQKEAVATLGHLGTYEVTDLIEIPQRFARNDVTKKLIDNKMLLIFAKNQEKFVKFVDKGETEITEDGQNKGDLADDFQTYEVQREMGVSTILPRYFGVWKITE